MGEPDRLSHPAYEVVRPVTERASVLLARNPSIMTLEGTNTWVLRAPGARECVVVDPGPDAADHVRRIAALGPVAAVLLTHHHADHVRALPALRRRLAASGREPVVLAVNPTMVAKSQSPLRFLAPSSRSINAVKDGQRLQIAGVRLTVAATPGHTSDSASFLVHGDQDEVEAVLTGDMILGYGSTVLDRSSGDLGDYLRSMRKLMSVGEGVVGLPGHGPHLADVAAAAQDGLRHRQERLEQVRSALAKLGPNASAWKVTREVYRDVDAKLLPSALSSTKVQLRYLRREQVG
ncbi:beta-lactamase [Segniliparus rotundus DSM 44985]|uniref:Beta-lactamase n=1 Tax=Segniliparus rotundus (strain ATCC BAA-972 / CDC 1076 / CIP 108378 / DSM 44985 / JCM 13578) TaxID=640132 RepID=D6ZF60_SEGRD|nr:MBL fold metallo-hydrolase [Segniliparus rotundus]ADG97584.1 beta-lactamase [Segniliparus rotundus DSM 44985]